MISTHYHICANTHLHRVHPPLTFYDIKGPTLLVDPTNLLQPRTFTIVTAFYNVASPLQQYLSHQKRGKTGDSKYLTLNSDNAVVVAALAASTDTAANKENKRQAKLDQGYGGGDLQMVTLQSFNGHGFFAADKQTSGLEVKYTALAWSVKLEDVADDNVTIRYTKGSKDLVLAARNSDTKFHFKLSWTAVPGIAAAYRHSKSKVSVGG
ncbi:hypothetical protein B0H13DRAFT_1908936 [Mycena leptocephala]|nr:hypothetical protein B0H13DRAFT_1908936 [Mycena leptocephala]